VAKNPEKKTETRYVAAQLIKSLKKLGGKASIPEIYEEVKRLYKADRRDLPASFEAVVRRTLQIYCPQSKQFRGEGLFQKTARGFWKEL